MHGGDPDSLPVPCDTNNSYGRVQILTKWNTKSDGSIECAPKELGGCGRCVMELKCILTNERIFDLIAKACHMINTVFQY
ncbi:hypothetical protein TSUD_380310 [Trifolium subterraneum]|uniref:Uncharacterized protein n=1 Tax=Trifolium subterraneum TaxID=3900 RepID=A0A2Z6PP53_TRISU|nr:hypothetical protein TSUD_380310 [Trifolium subterraneum]